jgi:hypothetical protein
MKVRNLVLGFLSILIASSLVIITLPGAVRIEVAKDYTKLFYALNQADGKETFVLGGTEYNQLYKDSILISPNSVSLKTSMDKKTNITTITRTAKYPNNVSIRDVYTFNGNLRDIESVPVKRLIYLSNAQGYQFNYHVEDLPYGFLKNISSPYRTGRMTISFEDGYTSAQLTKPSVADISYNITSNNQVLNIRLFDPTTLWSCDFATNSCGVNGGTVDTGNKYYYTGAWGNIYLPVNISCTECNISLMVKTSGFTSSSDSKYFVATTNQSGSGSYFLTDFVDSSNVVAKNPPGYSSQSNNIAVAAWYKYTFVLNRTAGTSRLYIYNAAGTDIGVAYGTMSISSITTDNFFSISTGNQQGTYYITNITAVDTGGPAPLSPGTLSIALVNFSTETNITNGSSRMYQFNVSCSSGSNSGCGNNSLFFDPRIAPNTTGGRLANMSLDYEAYLNKWLANNATVNKTIGGQEYLFVPWFGSSSDTSASALKCNTAGSCTYKSSDCAVVSQDFDNFCMVTDELSQVTLALSMSRNTTLVNRYGPAIMRTVKALNRSNVYYTKSSSCQNFDFGWNTAWKAIYANGVLNITTDKVSAGTCEDENSAVDADYRFYWAVQNFAKNPALTDETFRNEMISMAGEFCADLANGPIIKSTQTSTVGAGRVVDYYQAAGVRNTMNGFTGLTSGEPVYPGYMFDGAIVMYSCYKNTGNVTYLNVSKSLVEQWLVVANWTSSTGFRSHAQLRGRWSGTGTPTWVATSGGSTTCQDGFDAIRAANAGTVRYLEQWSGDTINDKLAEFVSEWLAVNATDSQDYANNSYMRSWCADGTANAGSYDSTRSNSHSLGLGAELAMGDSNESVRQRQVVILGKFDGTQFTDNSGQLGVYMPAFAVTSLGIALGYSDDAFFNGTTPGAGGSSNVSLIANHTFDSSDDGWTGYSTPRANGWLELNGSDYSGTLLSPDIDLYNNFSLGYRVVFTMQSDNSSNLKIFPNGNPSAGNNNSYYYFEYDTSTDNYNFKFYNESDYFLICDKNLPRDINYTIAIDFNVTGRTTSVNVSNSTETLCTGGPFSINQATHIYDYVRIEQGTTTIYDKLWDFKAYNLGYSSPPLSKGGLIPRNAGSPFYTTDYNPQNASNTAACLANLGNGSSCLVNFTVYANGTFGNRYESYMYVKSNQSDEVNSSLFYITIQEFQRLPINNSRVIYHQMNNNTITGSISLDSSGEDHDGSLSGLTYTTDVQFNYSTENWEFNGYSGYFSLSSTSNQSLNLTNKSWTANVWVKPQKGNANSDSRTIWTHHWNYGSNQGLGWQINTANQSVVYFGQTTYTSSFQVPMNRWSMLTLTYNGTHVCHILNVSTTSCLSATYKNDSTSGILLGAEGTTTGPIGYRQFNGSLDEFSLWNNRTLDSTDIANLYSIGHNGSGPYYPNDIIINILQPIGPISDYAYGTNVHDAWGLNPASQVNNFSGPGIGYSYIPSNYTWHRETLGEAGIDYLRLDLSYGSKISNALPNRDAESWLYNDTNFTYRYFDYVNFTNFDNFPYGWGYQQVVNNYTGAIGRSTDAYDGQYSMNITKYNSSGSGTGFNYYSTGVLEPGVYNLSVMIKGNATNVHAHIQNLNTYSSFCYSTASPNIATWTMISCQATLVTPEPLGYRIVIESGSGNNTYLLWDHARLTHNNRTWFKLANLTLETQYLDWANSTGKRLMYIISYMDSRMANLSIGCNDVTNGISARCPPYDSEYYAEGAVRIIDNITLNNTYKNYDIEVWNEPDIGFWMPNISRSDTAARAPPFVRLYNATYDEFKAWQPTVQVGCCGFASMTANDQKQFAEAVLYNITPKFDFISTHKYTTGDADDDIKGQFDSAQAVCTAVGKTNCRILITEFNEASVTNKNTSSLYYLYKIHIAQSLITAWNHYPNATMVQYQWAQGSRYSTANTTTYPEYPQKWTMVAEPALENEKYMPYDVYANMSDFIPSGSMIYNNSNIYDNEPFLYVSVGSKNDRYGMVVINNREINTTTGVKFVGLDVSALQLKDRTNGITYTYNSSFGGYSAVFFKAYNVTYFDLAAPTYYNTTISFCPGISSVIFAADVRNYNFTTGKSLQYNITPQNFSSCLYNIEVLGNPVNITMIASPATTATQKIYCGQTSGSRVSVNNTPTRVITNAGNSTITCWMDWINVTQSNYQDYSLSISVE